MIAGHLANVSHIPSWMCFFLIAVFQFQDASIYLHDISFVVRESSNVFWTGSGEAILKYCVAVLFLLNVQLKPTWIAFIGERSH